MTLLDFHTHQLDRSLQDVDFESLTTNYFTFIPEPDFAELAEIEALADFTPFDSGHADLSTAYARCSDGNGTLTHLFFSEDNFDLARAKAICGKCRLAPSCLADALDREESYGVWGGELLVNGAIVAVKRGRGRPPKKQVSLASIDEVPLPPHLVA
ncbi:MAG TPA: WhiB family transcriptional regulator [Ilumatobacter sp.]|nr:WhiB family transcriptional regulator [Ilumatobacter sp.]